MLNFMPVKTEFTKCSDREAKSGNLIQNKRSTVNKEAYTKEKLKQEGKHEMKISNRVQDKGIKDVKQAKSQDKSDAD